MCSISGIIRFCRPDGTGLQSLVGILYLPFTDVRVCEFLLHITFYYNRLHVLKCDILHFSALKFRRLQLLTPFNGGKKQSPSLAFFPSHLKVLALEVLILRKNYAAFLTLILSILMLFTL